MPFCVGLQAERRQGDRDQQSGRQAAPEERPPQDAPDHGAPEAALAHALVGRLRARHLALVHAVAELREQGRQTVSEPITDTATTRIVPAAKLLKVVSPLMNMADIATITVTPEIRTERPEVAAAASIDAHSVRPAARSSRAHA